MPDSLQAHICRKGFSIRPQYKGEEGTKGRGTTSKKK